VGDALAWLNDDDAMLFELDAGEVFGDRRMG
jgi:hypothetical protein